MNWYRVTMPHDSFGAQDVGRAVLLEGNMRQAELQRMGYLELLGRFEEHAEQAVAGAAERVKKRGRRGQSFEAGPPEVEPVGEAAGDAARGADGATD